MKPDLLLEAAFARLYPDHDADGHGVIECEPIMTEATLRIRCKCGMVILCSESDLENAISADSSSHHHGKNQRAKLPTCDELASLVCYCRGINDCRVTEFIGGQFVIEIDANLALGTFETIAHAVSYVLEAKLPERYWFELCEGNHSYDPFPEYGSSITGCIFCGCIDGRIELRRWPDGFQRPICDECFRERTGKWIAWFNAHTHVTPAPSVGTSIPVETSQPALPGFGDVVNQTPPIEDAEHAAVLDDFNRPIEPLILEHEIEHTSPGAGIEGAEPATCIDKIPDYKPGAVVHCQGDWLDDWD